MEGGEAAAEGTTETKTTDRVNINIRCSNGSKLTVQISLDSTVGSFKEAVATNCDIPTDQQCLNYKGRILEDDQTLQSYGLEADHTVHLVRGFAASNSTGGANTSGANTTTTNTRRAGANESGGAQGNTRRPTAGGDARQQTPPTGLGGLGMPHLEGTMGGMLTQLMQNPAISQMMQSILSNPQTRNQILGLNTEQRGMPDLNSLREVMQSPEFLSLFSSPETLQQLMSFQQALLSQVGQQQSTQGEPGQTGGGTGLEADHTVHLVRGFAASNTTGGTNTSGANTTTTNSRGAGANEGGGGLGGPGLGASLFPGLGVNGMAGSGPSGLVGANLPDLEQMLQPFSNNPNMVREIMNTPAMQNLINNPEIVRNLIMNNPQMQELMDRNPELAHILNDPSTLRQTLEATFNMLRLMYENVQKPFLNATTMAGNTGNDGVRNLSTNPSTTNSEATSPVPNTNPLPNPWSSTGSGGAQGNTRRPTAGRDARQQAPTGLGGLGVPDLEGMMGGMPVPAMLTRLMQNPALSGMVQIILPNPQTMNQILGLNTEQRGMLGLNSLREVMQNPEFLRLFSSPETLQVPLTRPSLTVIFFFMFIKSCSGENAPFSLPPFTWYWAVVYVVIFVISAIFIGGWAKSGSSSNPASSTRRRNKKKKGKGPITQLVSTSCPKFRHLVLSNTQLGSGCDGTIVLKGTHLGYPVAVKRLVKGIRTITKRELQIVMDSGRHTNITHVYDFEDDEHFNYLVMELCGCSLQDLIYHFSDIEKPVFNDQALEFLREVEAQIEPPVLWENCRPTPLLLKLLRDVVAGLTHLHCLGIVHRDLKPGNILISKDGPLCAKISDFGISRKLDKDRDSLGRDVSGHGTLGWQAREVLNGERQTRAVDAFSLGCVLYFCLSGGGHPFGKPIERDVNIQEGVPPDLFALGVFPEAADLLSLLLNSEPDQRPDVQEVSFHPLFWLKGKKLNFIRDVSDKLERCNQSDVVDDINNIDVGGIWGNMVSVDLYNDLSNGGHRKYEFGSVTHLLRAIRNKYTHYGKLTPALQGQLGPIPDGFFSYFATTFPNLLVDVYRIIYTYWKDDEFFHSYFKGGD